VIARFSVSHWILLLSCLSRSSPDGRGSPAKDHVSDRAVSAATTEPNMNFNFGVSGDI
jgi:hypothetical protein